MESFKESKTCQKEATRRQTQGRGGKKEKGRDKLLCGGKFNDIDPLQDSSGSEDDIPLAQVCSKS